MHENERGSVSVVVGCYNGEAYVTRQLDSLIRQSRRPFEIIIADDGSTDRTREIVAEFRDRHSALVPVQTLFNPHNLGFGENFLHATRSAGGEFVAFCDQDDIWHETKLEICEAEFCDPEIVLVTHQANLIDQAGKLLGPFDQGIAANAKRAPLRTDPWRCFAGFTMVFRRRMLELVDIDSRCRSYLAPNVGIEHDRWIMYLANLLGCTKELARPLAEYRQHGHNLFGARKPMPIDFPAYVRTAHEQRTLIDLIAAAAGSEFPLFDRDRSRAYWDNACRMMEARLRLREVPSTVGALGLFVGSVVGGAYMNDFNRRPRWGAIARDLDYIRRSVRR